MSTKIINTTGDNAPNYDTVRIAAIDLPVIPTGGPASDGEHTVPIRRSRGIAAQESNADKTVPLTRDIKTTPLRHSLQTFLPLPPQKWVHGWLVAVSGPMKGRSFPVEFGNNTAGRSTANAICMPDDIAISRSQFAIKYLQSKGSFVVAPINSATQITTLDDGDELIFPTPIREGETMKLSPETSVRFIPFCDAQYKWDYSEAAEAPQKAQPELPPKLAPAPASPFPNISKEPLQTPTVPIHFPASDVSLPPAPESADATVRIGTGTATGTGLDATERIRLATNRIAEDDDHTHVFRPSSTGSAAPTRHPAESWVQGWLVAISGPMKGMYFPITVGINQGGRDASCRICLSADECISGAQFAIRFVKNKKQFYVSNIETATQQTYLNNEELTGYEQIKRGDILQVSGQTKLRFIPLCNDSFCWDYPENL